MNIDTNSKTFADACLDTAFGAVCVKSRDYNAGHQFGRIVAPVITQGMITDIDALYRLIVGNDEVIVRGHGWEGEKPFVWKGDGHEFHATWEID